MSDAITRDLKRKTKIARTLIRLKHSLRADEEIDNSIAQMKAIVAEGSVPQLETSLEDLMGSVGE